MGNFKHPIADKSLFNSADARTTSYKVVCAGVDLSSAQSTSVTGLQTTALSTCWQKKSVLRYACECLRPHLATGKNIKHILSRIGRQLTAPVLTTWLCFKISHKIV